MHYESIEQVKKIISAFEDASIKRDAWGHPEHLIIAFHYLDKHEPEDAFRRMKSGILNLLDSFDLDLEKEMPYHETLTRFWMDTVSEFRKEKSTFCLANINELIKTRDKHYPEKFYSKSTLFSKKARREYVEPDKDGGSPTYT